VSKGLPVTRVISRITLQVRRACDCGCWWRRRLQVSDAGAAALLVSSSSSSSTQAPLPPRAPTPPTPKPPNALHTRRLFTGAQEILSDAVARLAPPEKRASIVQNSANVVSFEEGTDPATGARQPGGGGGGAWLCGRVVCGAQPVTARCPDSDIHTHAHTHCVDMPCTPRTAAAACARRATRNHAQARGE
jgi:hypothetical protein